MQRAAQEGGPDRAAIVQQTGERRALEVGEPGPEPDERRARELRLEAGQALERGERRQVRALEQELAGEHRPVERALGEDADGHRPQAGLVARTRIFVSAKASSPGTIRSERSARTRSAVSPVHPVRSSQALAS